ESLHEAIRGLHGPERPRGWASEMRGLLDRLVDVCYTIAFAHSRGVIHRDLTPGNIMLGINGETLVIDWGLAKVINRPAPAGEGGSQETHPAGGIPAPRQVHRRDRPGPRADWLEGMGDGPEARYASPLDLGDDIARWLAKKPVTARPTTEALECMACPTLSG